MDIREQIRTAMLDLSDTEEIIVLSVMIDALMEKVQNSYKSERSRGWAIYIFDEDDD